MNPLLAYLISLFGGTGTAGTAAPATAGTAAPATAGTAAPATAGTAAPATAGTAAPATATTKSATAQPQQGNWITQLLNLIMAGGGAHYGSQELDAIRQIYNMQRAAAAQAMNIHPGQLGTLATQMAAPLNKQLAYQVTNAADQNSAMRGMAQAPGAVAAGEAGALAPFEQQNQHIGAQLASNANELSLERVLPSFQVKGMDYLKILDQLQKLGRGETFALPGTP